MKQLLLILSLFLSAFINSGSKEDATGTNKEFEAFLKKFKTTPLPLIIKACKVSTVGCNSFDDTDTLFIKELSGWVPYYKFKPNGNYIAVISLGMADCSLPILTTYTIDGKKIDEESIAIGGCGAGPGFTCEEFMTVRKDYTLYTSDTIREAALDSLGNDIKGTEEKYVVYKKGRLLSSGKIELTGEIKENLKK
jgi:hypothetical protein